MLGAFSRSKACCGWRSAGTMCRPPAATGFGSPSSPKSRNGKKGGGSKPSNTDAPPPGVEPSGSAAGGRKPRKGSQPLGEPRPEDVEEFKQVVAAFEAMQRERESLAELQAWGAQLDEVAQQLTLGNELPPAAPDAPDGPPASVSESESAQQPPAAPDTPASVSEGELAQELPPAATDAPDAPSSSDIGAEDSVIAQAPEQPASAADGKGGAPPPSSPHAAGGESSLTQLKEKFAELTSSNEALEAEVEALSHQVEELREQKSEMAAIVEVCVLFPTC